MGLALLIWICSILQKLLCYVSKAKQRCAKEWRLSEMVHAVNIHTYGGHNIESEACEVKQKLNAIYKDMLCCKPFLRIFSIFATFFSVV